MKAKISRKFNKHNHTHIHLNVISYYTGLTRE